jgi:hypothetical protein
LQVLGFEKKPAAQKLIQPLAGEYRGAVDVGGDALGRVLDILQG